MEANDSSKNVFFSVLRSYGCESFFSQFNTYTTVFHAAILVAPYSHLVLPLLSCI